MVALTLIGIRCMKMATGNGYFDYGDHEIRNEHLILPEVVADDPGVEGAMILHPLFNLIWNACGFSKSRNFDDAGNWAPRRN